MRVRHAELRCKAFLLLQTTQDDAEEKQEVPDSLASAKRISMDVNSSWYFFFQLKENKEQC